MSSGIPSSHVLSRWTAPVPPTRAHPGPKAREPAVQSRGTPATYRALASRPTTSTSMLSASISASTRARRARRKASSSGRTSVTAIRRSERVVRIIGHGFPAVLRDQQDLFGAVAGGALFPDDRLEDENHPFGQNERRVERLSDVAADIGHLRAVDAETVTQIEMGHPRFHASGGCDRRRCQLR